MVALISLIAGLASIISMAGPAAAAPEIVVDAPSQVSVGDQIEISATITDDGSPVANADATVSYIAKIGGSSGWAVLTTARTDDNGKVTFSYLQAAVDASRMRVSLIDSSGKSLAETKFEVTVTDTNQQHASSAGVDVPILGVWWLLLVIGIVWVLILIAVSNIVKVGKRSDLEKGPRRALPQFTFGLVLFTAVGMFLVILSRPTLHANLEPTKPFDRVTVSVVGEEYDYVGFSNADAVANRPADMSGEQLYVTTGCASCHGISGTGGIIGPALVKESGSVMSLSSMIEEVRDGPKGMPAYTETRLTDDEISRIHDYLFGPTTN